MPDITIGRLRGGFCVIWHEDGKRRRHQLTARTPADAEREAIDVYRRETLRPGQTTVADLWEAYASERQGRPCATTMRYEWPALAPTFAHLRPDQIEIEHSRGHTEARREAGIKDGTIRTELNRLRTVLNWAHQRRLIAFSPAIERPSPPAPKDRWLTEPEIARLYTAAETTPHLALAIRLMLSTGCRVAAALDLTWDRVDLERRQIDLRPSTTGPRKGRAVVAINDGLMAALVSARAAALTDHVIEWNGKPVASIKTAFNKATARARLPGVTPHVLRHTAAVHLAAAGVPMQKIAQMLGHSNTSVTERTYARFAPDHMREEAAVLDFGAAARVVAGGGKVQ
ncbi:MAG: site-specific integrase [Pseudomonadota bacterium]